MSKLTDFSNSSDEELAMVLKNIIAKENALDPNRINLSDRLIDDLNLDSLDLIELIVDIETEYDLQIDDYILDDVYTVQDALDLVKKYIRSQETEF